MRPAGPVPSWPGRPLRLRGSRTSADAFSRPGLLRRRVKRPARAPPVVFRMAAVPSGHQFLPVSRTRLHPASANAVAIALAVQVATVPCVPRRSPGSAPAVWAESSCGCDILQDVLTGRCPHGVREAVMAAAKRSGYLDAVPPPPGLGAQTARRYDERPEHCPRALFVLDRKSRQEGWPHEPR
jgi:hypothetical protein